MKSKLHPGVKWQWRISSYVGSLFFVIFLGIWVGFAISTFTENALQTIFLSALFILIILIIWTEIWIYLSYNRWFYEFTQDNLKIEYGVIWKTYKNVPYERVQNVDIHRGIIARVLGFSVVSIQTAGYSGGYSGRNVGYGAEGTIPAVEINQAEKIRDFVIKKISKKS